MPKIGDRFSTTQSQLLQNAKLLETKEQTGGKDGVWSGPVKDETKTWDLNGDGKADVRTFTRTQDSGAWSYDGQTGKQAVTQRSIELLDSQGRVTDEFRERSVMRSNGKVTNQLRGEREMTDLIGARQHTEYLPDGRRSISWEASTPTEDANGNVSVEVDPSRSKTQTYD